MLDCQLGKKDFDELEEELEGVELTAEQKKTFQGLKANATVSEHFMMLRRSRGSQEAMASARKDFYEIYQGGVYPTGSMKLGFWDILRGHAEETNDVKLMEDCVAHLKEGLKDSKNPRAKKFLEDIEAKLAAMKSG